MGKRRIGVLAGVSKALEGARLRRNVFAACATLAAGLGLAVGLGALSAEARDRASGQEFRLLELEGRTVRWTAPAEGLPATITYAFLTGPKDFPGARNCDSMLPPEAALDASRISSEAFRAETRAAFALWEEAANVVFKEVPVADAGILIGADAKDRGRAFTNVALKAGSQRGVGSIRQSLICLNPNQPWKIGFDGNLDVYDLRFTMAHEIGHAIGLDHPSPQGQLMSFRYVEDGRTLTAGDVAGVHALYGRKGTRQPTPILPTDAASSAALSVPADGDRAARERTFGLGEREARAGLR